MNRFLLFSLVCCFMSPCFAFAEEDFSVVPSSWLEEVRDKIRKEEYAPSLQESDYKGESFSYPKYHFANRANNLRAYFDESGMELIDREIDDKDNWNLKIKSLTVGDSDKKISENSDVSIDGNNIKFEDNGMKVVYSNSENGIEQNISIEEGSKFGFALGFNVETENLDITSEEDRFILNSGEEEIVYQITDVRDANEKELSYSLSDEEDRLIISWDNNDVAYPLKISANITSSNPSSEDLSISLSGKERGLGASPAWWVESNQESADFGYSVSTAGDVNGDGYSDVIVGAHLYDHGQSNEGKAFVYYGSSSGLSTSANWTRESNQEGAQFGNSVASAGDVNGDGYSDVIVGAWRYNNGERDQGRAYLYQGSSSGLSTSYSWRRDGQENANFGYSVASAGDVNGDGYSDVIVGAPMYVLWLNELFSVGEAYLYQGSSSGLSTSYSWKGMSKYGGDNFGYSVSTAGDVNGDGYSDVIVGAFGYTYVEAMEGAAFVYYGSYNGLSSSPGWEVESNVGNVGLGFSVSTAGDINGDGYSDVIVSAPNYGRGRVYVYDGSPSGLTSGYSWMGEGDYASYFGWSVSTAGDVNGDGYSDVIVGAPEHDNGQTNEGKAYLYNGGPTGLSSSPAWTAESYQDYAHLGESVSCAGDVNGDGYSDVIVGVPYYNNGQIDEGVAVVYYGWPEGLSSSAKWRVEPNQEMAQFGHSVASAGDVNGDGYSDVIVGAWLYDNGQTNEGRAYVFNGSSSGLTTSYSWRREGGQDGANFGYSVASAGDVNGDGYSDVIVGARCYDNGETDEGRAYVYHGSSSGLSTSYSWRREGGQANAYFGTSVASAGDVNGDGYSDVIVGASGHDHGQTNEGRAYVYHGSSSGLSTSVAWYAESDQADAWFGVSVASAGDVNGDGYSDVIVGAYKYDNGETDEGRVYVYLGSSGGLSTSPGTAEGNQEGASFGISVASAGDVNGDGYSDVIVGAYTYDNGQKDEGMAYVFHGGPYGLSSVNWVRESNQEMAQFGHSVASAGDVNGDGYSDVIVGAYGYDQEQTDEGKIYVYAGGPSGLSSSSLSSFRSDKEGAKFGWQVACAGDVNGDGYSDVIVGSSCYTNGEENEGRAYVFYGNASKGLSLRATQSPTNGSRPVQLGNATGGKGVQLNVLGRTPAGRGKVKLQWEVKPLGQLFDGSSLSTSSSWYNTGTGGVAIGEDATGLSNAKAYHWRARLKYNPSNYNGSVYSRWLSIGPNGWNEKDFITTALSTTRAAEADVEDHKEETNLKLSIFPSVSNRAFSIDFYISESESDEDIKLAVYNKAGMKVADIFTGRQEPGKHNMSWYGMNNSSQPLPNDIYFVSLVKGKQEPIVKKIVLLR